MSKADLKNAMSALNVKQPLRLQNKAPSFQAPSPLKATKTGLERDVESPGYSAHSESQSCNTEETRSISNPVENEQGSNLTRSKMNPVQDEPSQKSTESSLDPVQQPSAGRFTKVPHELLRGADNFSDPVDFMIYLHMYSYSWGFARETASMSQGQLEDFTGASRNTVRRSLERLIKQGWIKMVEDYECARMSRRWKVISPEQKLKRKTGSNSNPVQGEPSAELTQSGSKMNSVTGSKNDPYKESITKEKSKNSLSLENQALMKYFSELKPQAKRESEWRSFQTLRKDYSESDIGECLELLFRRGVGEEGSRCHSPMAFLAKAMDGILPEIEAERKRLAEKAERQKAELTAVRVRIETEAREKAETENKERAFKKTFPGEHLQLEAISKFLGNLPFRPHTEIARFMAINRWWDELTQSEKTELQAL